MNLIELEASIKDIRNRIFSYEITNLQSEVLVLAEEVCSKASNLSEEELNYIGTILDYLTTALANKDYLVLGDILEYELLPFISKLVNGDMK